MKPRIRSRKESAVKPGRRARSGSTGSERQHFVFALPLVLLAHVLERVAQRLLVILGDGGQKRRDLDLVKTPEAGVEILLSEVERAHIHAVILRFAYRNIA